MLKWKKNLQKLSFLRHGLRGQEQKYILWRLGSTCLLGDSVIDLAFWTKDEGSAPSWSCRAYCFGRVTRKTTVGKARGALQRPSPKTSVLSGSSAKAWDERDGKVCVWKRDNLCSPSNVLPPLSQEAGYLHGSLWTTEDRADRAPCKDEQREKQTSTAGM